MEPSRRLSIGDLAEQLLDDRLIEACELTKDRVTIVQDSSRHTFPYDQARSFMLAMMRGRTWSLEARIEGDGGSRFSDGPSWQAAPSALNELASVAANLGIIAEFQRLGSGRVKIGLSACESEMDEDDAVVFLADCIHHHLRTMREDAQHSVRRAEPAGPSEVGQAA